MVGNVWESTTPLVGCSHLPQIEPESGNVTKAHENVKEMMEARPKNYLARQKIKSP